MITVGGHTFDETLLTDGVIIDVGCRGFEFADYFKNNHVFCIDPDIHVFDDGMGMIRNVFGQTNFVVAISDKIGASGIYRNGEATCLQEIDPDQSHRFEHCSTTTIEEIYKLINNNVDVLKLDCEGAEYIILGETFKPIPKQISVEFHHHTVPLLHNQCYHGIIERLSKDYTMHNDVWEQRHGCGYNFWDTLFIRRW